METAWHALPLDDIWNELQSTRREEGLTKEDAAARLVKYGQNKLPPPKERTILHMIWEQFYNIITFVLIGAAIIAAIFKEWIELGFIVAVILVNIVIGVIQEGKAEAATKAIKNMTSASTVVIRNGNQRTVPSTTLVPGDVITLTSGDRIPADIRWLTADDIQVEEAALTGESLAVAKITQPVPIDAGVGDRTCMGFSSTLISTGSGTAVVVVTGKQTQIGKIVDSMGSAKPPKAPLVKQIEDFGFRLSVLCILIAILTFVVAYWGRKFALVDAFGAAVSVAVALIPEGLPTVVTICLALGVQHMAARKAIIRQMPAVETLGALTCICSDKTGTLTKNEMTAVSLHHSGGTCRVSGSGYNPEGEIRFKDDPLTVEHGAALRQLLLPAVLCSDATLMPGMSEYAQRLLKTEALGLPLAQLQLPENTDTSSPDLPPVPHNIKSNWEVTGDPTEGALLCLASKAGLNFRTLNLLLRAIPRIATLPFNSKNKFMATVHAIVNPSTGKTHFIMFVKGAPDVLLPRCATEALNGDPWSSQPVNPAHWSRINSELAGEGKRVLALCWREVDEKLDTVKTETIMEGEPTLQLNCLVAILDPPRKEAIRAVTECHNAGIMVKMITGDHAQTARTIGTWIGIEADIVITGAELEKMSDEELEAKVEACSIYARASPDHKLRIVKALQKHGHICAMTGDGVNDSPALRQADVGVGMGITGTEVAKDASRMVLQDDNFATLAHAVEEGRRTYANLTKLVMFLLPTSFAQGLSIAVAVFLGVQEPLTSIQILTVNMLTASSLGLVLAAEEAEANIMQKRPRVQGKPLVGKHITWRTFFVGIEMIAAMLLQQYWSRQLGGSVRRGHTMAMNTLVISQCFYCLACRKLGSTLSFKAVYRNPWLFGMALFNAAFQCLITYTPGVQEVWETEAIDGIEWLRILLFAIIIYLSVEIEKKVGPPLIRPCILPTIKRMNAFCTRGPPRKRPAPYVPPVTVVADAPYVALVPGETTQLLRESQGNTATIHT